MSIESARVFIERMKTDEAFRNRVTESETPQVRKALIADGDFDFTKEEIGSVTAQLSDEEVTAVAKGWMCWIGCRSEISEYRRMLVLFGIGRAKGYHILD